MEKSKCPEIRFIGSSGDWVQSNLAECTDLLTGNPFNSKEFTSNGIFLVRGMNVKRGYLDTSTNISEYWPSSKGLEHYLLEPKDIVIQMDGALIGKSYAKVNSKDLPALLVQRVARVRSNNVEIEFIYQYIHRDFLRHISGIKTETAVPHLSLNDIRDFTIFLPEKQEQTQIGNFFQNLDQSIALHQKKLAQTQNLKKAMLEKMFPKAGDKQPEIRLKGFSGDWPGLRIFDLAQNGKLNNGVFNDQNKIGKGYKLINVLDMYIETSIDEKKLTLLDLDRKEFEQNKVKYGDVFFTRSSLVKEGIAFSNVYLGHSNDITYDGHLIKLSPNLELVDPIFLNYCLKSSKIRTQLILGGKSTTMTTIGQQEVGETIVGLPSMSEQLKIGQFFKRLDETLLLQQQKLQTLKNLKRAFLEKMFV